MIKSLFLVIICIFTIASSCPPDPEGCQSDYDCYEDRVCEMGECIDIPECTGNHECRFDEICENNTCIQHDECQSEYECSPGMLCINNECVMDRCNSDSECTYGRMCLNHKCVDAECRHDTDCSPGWECQNNNCIEAPSGFPRGYAMILCGCHGPVQLGSVAMENQCDSGWVEAVSCGILCQGGGISYAWLCQ